MFRKGIVLIIIGLFIGATNITIGETELNNVLNNKQLNFTQLAEVWVNDDYNETNVEDFGIINFSKIQDGIDNVSISGTVWVYNGTYKENLEISKTINLIALNEENIGSYINGAVIDGEGNSNVVKIDTSYVTINNFTIQNCKNEENFAGIFITANSNNNIISWNTISLNYDGILLQKCKDNTISNNHINNNTCDGISIIYSSEIKIYTNTIVDNKYGLHFISSSDNEGRWNYIANNHHGVEFWNSCLNNLLYLNNVTKNSEYGLYLYKCNFNLIVQFNNFIKNGKQNIYFEACFLNFYSRNYYDDWNPSNRFYIIRGKLGLFQWPNFDFYPLDAPEV